MTVLLNYRPVLCQPTGIGVYANAVLPALEELPHILIKGVDGGAPQNRLMRLAWTQFYLPLIAKQNKASLVFTPAPEGYLGYQATPQVVMVHDLRPISHPERSFQSLYFRAWVPPLLRSSRHVLTNSDFTAREIQRFTGIPDRQITITPLAYDDQTFTPSQDICDFTDSPYFLHVGQQYPHKNLRRLILAFASLVTTHPQLRLVLAGKSHPTETPVLKSLVRELALEERIQFRSYVSYNDLADLYRGALAFVYPSLWEGFGLPVLEAMACGTPVVTSTGSGLSLTAGDAALQVNPSNTLAISSALRDLLEQPGLRQKLSQLGLIHSSQFSWKRTAAATKAELTAIIGASA